MTRSWIDAFFQKVVLSILFWMVTLSLQANGDDPSQWILSKAPGQYIVREGDTLWEIACKFLHDPGRWQQIWHVNPEIENPNLIYPGDSIVLTNEAGKPKLSLKRNNRWESYNPKTGIWTMRPHVRVSASESAIPTIPLNIIGPFLNESRVVSEIQATKSPRVVALDEDHIVVGTGDRMYVSGLAPTAKDTMYAVFRHGKTYVDPKTKAPLGIEGLVLGKAQLEVPGELARFVITKSYAEVKIGDQIMTTAHEELDPYFSPKLPLGPAKGQIISVFGGLNQIGQYQILAVTGGKNLRREIGDVLDVYQTHKDIPSRLTIASQKNYKFPPLKIGTCVVFRVFDLVSYVLVMNATRPIYLLDGVGRS